MNTSALKPLVGVVACLKQIGHHPYQAVQEKYIRALTDGAGVLPLLIPSLGQERVPLASLLARVDGLLFTGSPSNVEPHHYQGPASAPGTLHDPARDETSLPMIRAAVAAGLPILGICRGFQEMNVAFGGSLHQKVHEVGGFRDHREDDTAPLDSQYAPAHAVHLTPGGWFARWMGRESIPVNSLHSQGVERLGQGLCVEARAEDGLIEGFRVEAAQAFAVAVQWHPEWRMAENAFSLRLFAEFGEACRQYANPD
ncbi:MAG: gamma-glutamyl-gamma-aminobutyrate hydrolase family protein [Gammaproteobacteria bacterium]|nr:gamma-glutamyl-gamma-aminobutyrate hydrolase family protein [Gammaproteobacteria bacterium]